MEPAGCGLSSVSSALAGADLTVIGVGITATATAAGTGAAAGPAACCPVDAGATLILDTRRLHFCKSFLVKHLLQTL